MLPLASHTFLPRCCPPHPPPAFSPPRTLCPPSALLSDGPAAPGDTGTKGSDSPLSSVRGEAALRVCLHLCYRRTATLAISPVCCEVDPRTMWPQPSLVVEHGGACSLGTQSLVFHRRDAGSQFLERGPLGSWGFSHRKNVGKVLNKETPGAPSSWGDLDSAHRQLPGGPQGNSFFNLSFLLSEMAFPLGFPFQGCRGAGMRRCEPRAQ